MADRFDEQYQIGNLPITSFSIGSNRQITVDIDSRFSLFSLGFENEKLHLGAMPHPAGHSEGCRFSRVPTLLQYLCSHFEYQKPCEVGELQDFSG